MPTTKTLTIGQRIAKLREQRGLTRTQLHQLVPNVNIWRVEKDEYLPSVTVLEQIAQALDADLEIFFTPKK